MSEDSQGLLLIHARHCSCPVGGLVGVVRLLVVGEVHLRGGGVVDVTAHPVGLGPALGGDGCRTPGLDEEVIDRLEHDLGVWRPKENPQYVTTRDGDFYLDGQKWYPFGVNHMPSSGIGTEDYRFFEHYLSRRAYDPDIFDQLPRVNVEHLAGMND